jgi:alkylated DNA repair dioxygenase AlkB
MQVGLLGRGVPAVDPAGLTGLRRLALDATAWIDYLPGFVAGHQALLDELARTTRWRTERRQMYDRMVDVPRLVASIPRDGPGHPVLEQIRELLTAHYRTPFPHTGMGYYRAGADSVAWHGDYVARNMSEALVATVSLGEPRKFLLRPAGGGRSRSLMLGWGDLLVMGGSCQRTWQHCIPKVARADPRLAVMFRPTWYRAD